MEHVFFAQILSRKIKFLDLYVGYNSVGQPNCDAIYFWNISLLNNVLSIFFFIEYQL